MTTDNKFVEKLAFEILLAEKKLEGIGFEVIGVKDNNNNECLYVVREKKF